jgi:hypothetical protein
MALLRVESHGKPHVVRVQLDGKTAARLRRYARFANDGTIDSVVKAALNYSFDADKEFVEWEKDPENQKEVERPKRSPRAATGGENGNSAAAAAANAAKK